MLEKDPARRIQVRGIRKHHALDEEDLPSGVTLPNISPTEVQEAITTRRKSVAPDVAALRRTSQSLAASFGSESSTLFCLPPIHRR